MNSVHYSHTPPQCNRRCSVCQPGSQHHCDHRDEGRLRCVHCFTPNQWPPRRDTHVCRPGFVSKRDLLRHQQRAWGLRSRIEGDNHDWRWSWWRRGSCPCSYLLLLPGLAVVDKS